MIGLYPFQRAERLRVIPDTSPLGLRPWHCAGARLFSERYDLIAHLKMPKRPAVTEVGVGVGDFSGFLLETLNPSRFTAIDIFTMHELPTLWGIPSQEVFQDRTHLQYYRDRFSKFGDRVVIMEGDSRQCLEKLPDRSQDLIYIDANHEYESVRGEAALAARKLKSDGAMVFNDYTMYDSSLQVPYGVVQAVNEMVLAGGWQVVGFALNPLMFCDIALRRHPLGRLDRLVRGLV